MRRHVLLYGLLCGVLIAALQLMEYRWLVLEPLPVGLLFTLVAAGAFSRRRREPGAATAA